MVSVVRRRAQPLRSWCAQLANVAGTAPYPAAALTGATALTTPPSFPYTATLVSNVSAPWFAAARPEMAVPFPATPSSSSYAVVTPSTGCGINHGPSPTLFSPCPSRARRPTPSSTGRVQRCRRASSRRDCLTRSSYRWVALRLTVSTSTTARVRRRGRSTSALSGPTPTSSPTRRHCNRRV